MFAQEIRNCAGNTVGLGIWSAKGQRTRTTHTTVPSSGTLGLALQHNSLTTVSTIWHILEVPHNSPADIAGLLPYSDYILGTPEGVLHGESGLGELVEDHIGRPLRLYVYNNEYDVTREITIQPSRDWGGEGALGCTLGFGALHRLPAPLSEPVAGPGETLFSGEHGIESEIASFSNEIEGSRPGSATTNNFSVPAQTAATDFLVPAEIMLPPPMPMGSPSIKREKKITKVKGKGLNIDDYFMEGEQKSREQDYAPSSRKGPLPPPPKAGGDVPTSPPTSVSAQSSQVVVPVTAAEVDLQQEAAETVSNKIPVDEGA